MNKGTNIFNEEYYSDGEFNESHFDPNVVVVIENDKVVTKKVDNSVADTSSDKNYFEQKRRAYLQLKEFVNDNALYMLEYCTFDDFENFIDKFIK